MTTCTHWSFSSGFSAFRCAQKPIRGGACAVHVRYPDARLPGPLVPVERKP